MIVGVFEHKLVVRHGSYAPGAKGYISDDQIMLTGETLGRYKWDFPGPPVFAC